jgi:glycosyltransferase involved in cell wall biosynthesis
VKKIWIVTELFYPEETAVAFIFTRIANYLSDNYKVCVICGPEFYDSSKKEFIDNVSISSQIEIYRIKTLNLDKNSLVQRTIKVILLSVGMGFLMFKKIPKKGKVILATNPAPLLIFVMLIKYLKKLQLNILVHDVFPENAIPAKIFKNNKSIRFKIIKYIFDRAYSSADHLIVIGRDMKEIMSEKVSRFSKHTSISIIPNWSNPYKLDISNNAANSNSRLKIQYAGNIGRVQGLIEILNAFRLSNTNCLCLNFRGTGALYPFIQNFIKNNNLPNISINGGFSRIEENEILADCDIGLVSLSNGMYGLGVPSKAYHLLSAGKPILFIGENGTEISQLVLENGIGWSINIRNQNELIDFFNYLNSVDRGILLKMGQKSRLLAENEYNEHNILKLLQSKLELN